MEGKPRDTSPQDDDLVQVEFGNLYFYIAAGLGTGKINRTFSVRRKCFTMIPVLFQAKCRRIQTNEDILFRVKRVLNQEPGEVSVNRQPFNHRQNVTLSLHSGRSHKCYTAEVAGVIAHSCA
jgi:hypothetical protein